MRTLLRDLRYGFRVLRGSPGFAIVAVIPMAVAIAANTAVFSWIDLVWLRAFPGISEPERIVFFETIQPERERVNVSYADFRDYRDNLTLSEVAVSLQPNAFRIGQDDHAQRVWGELVSGNYFSVLGVQPHLGRVFVPEEYGDAPAGYPVAVISHRLWRGHFHSDPSVVGRTARINGRELTIVGVAPREFAGTTRGLAFDIWIPLVMGEQLDVMTQWVLPNRKTRCLQGVARLQPGATLDQAREEVAAVGRRLAVEHPDTNEGVYATLLEETDANSGAQNLMLAPLRILMGMAFVVLLIACVNISNLLSARSADRQREIGIRMALGAGRARLGRQLLTESLLLASLGAFAGIPLAMWMAQAMGYLLPPTGMPVLLDTRLNASALVFTLLICVGAALISGLTPVLHAIRPDVAESLKESGRSNTAAGASHRLRSAFVVSEVALALVALVGAGLFLRSFDHARSVDPGFNPDNVLVSRFALSMNGYSPEQRQQFCLRLQQRLESAPGVAAVSYTDTIPLGLGLGAGTEFEVEGYLPHPGENTEIDRSLIGPRYFELMETPLVEGREFTHHDDGHSAPVAIVNEAFVERYFSGGQPLDRRIRAFGKWFRVVGVARNSKYYYLDEAPRPYLFLPVRQTEVPSSGVGIAFFVRAAAVDALDTIRREAAAIDPNVGALDSMPLAEYISGRLFPQKIAATLLSVLGVMALLLVAVGLYGVMAYAVSQRVHEIGIRVALGARPLDVVGLIVRKGLVLTGVGVAVGVVAALAASRVVSGMLVDVSATDPAIFAGAVLFLGVVAVTASYLPARRATRVDPVKALRGR